MVFDTLMEELDKDMTQVLNKHAPLISRRCRSRRRDPWITPTVVQALKKFRMCERAYRKNRTEANKTRYQSERKAYDNIIYNPKTEYYRQFISENKADCKQIRKTFPEDSTRAMQFDGSENVTKFTSF